MPAFSNEELDRDMMDWWDKLQANKPPPPERQETEVDVKYFRFNEDKQGIPEPLAVKIEQ